MDLNPLRAFFSRRRTAYVSTFETPMGREVLTDLSGFCRAHVSTFHADARLHALAEGRREVWLRIANHLNLTDDQLFELATHGKAPKE